MLLQEQIDKLRSDLDDENNLHEIYSDYQLGDFLSRAQGFLNEHMRCIRRYHYFRLEPYKDVYNMPDDYIEAIRMVDYKNQVVMQNAKYNLDRSRENGGIKNYGNSILDYVTLFQVDEPRRKMIFDKVPDTTYGIHYQITSGSLTANMPYVIVIDNLLKESVFTLASTSAYTKWTWGAGWAAAAGGPAIYTHGTGVTTLSQADLSIVSGQTYTVILTTSGTMGAGITVSLGGGTASSAITSATTTTLSLVAGSTDFSLTITPVDGTFAGGVDTIYVMPATNFAYWHDPIVLEIKSLYNQSSYARVSKVEATTVTINSVAYDAKKIWLGETNIYSNLCVYTAVTECDLYLMDFSLNYVYEPEAMCYTGPGTIGVASTTATLTSGTTDKLKVGNTILIGTATRTITAITSSTTFTVSASWTVTAGATYYVLKLNESMPMPIENHSLVIRQAMYYAYKRAGDIPNASRVQGEVLDLMQDYRGKQFKEQAQMYNSILNGYDSISSNYILW